jgi:hypothetical protein
VHERINLAQFLGRQIVLGIEVFDRAAEAHREGADIEAGDRADTTLTCQYGSPGGIDGATDGRDDTKARNDNASLGQAAPQLGIDNEYESPAIRGLGAGQQAQALLRRCVT